MTGDGSKVQSCKDQYCIGTWNVRSMNQGKLEVVKQEMVRVNIDILEISELKWTGMGEFNSDDHYIYYCGQESLRRNGVVLIVNKRVQNAVFGYNLKNNRVISVCYQGKPFNSASSALVVETQTWITVMLNGLPWKQTEIILSFLRLHSSTAFQTLSLTMMATPFLLKDSCPQ